jgi:hypothetical protein
MNCDSDYAFLRAPFQQFCAQFKSNKRTLEKELSFFASHLKTMARSSGQLDRRQTQAAIQALRDRLNASLTAIKTDYELEDRALEVCEARVAHLSDPEYPRVLMRRVLVDYLQREGFFELAHKAAKHLCLESLTDVRLFEEAKEVQMQLRQRNPEPALRWCALHKSRLKRLNSQLEFQLELQKFLELVKERNIMGAIRFARAHFPKHPESLEVVQRAMGLLALHARPECQEIYKDLLEDSRWEQLCELFHSELLHVYSLSTDSLLAIYLRAGLTALKTPLCGLQPRKRCPVCSDLFQPLAAGLPLTSHSSSQLLCRILDKPMDEHNPPLALPNGQTYSQQGLNLLSSEGRVQDPETKSMFSVKDARRVFTV